MESSMHLNWFSEFFNFDTDFSNNQTCNVILTKNHTLIQLDRGWEGIPETLVINLVLCTILLSFFILVRSLAKFNSTLNGESNWLQFIYGDRTKQRTPVENRKFFSNLVFGAGIGSVFQVLFPTHITKCKRKNVSRRTSLTVDHSSPSYSGNGSGAPTSPTHGACTTSASTFISPSNATTVNIVSPNEVICDEETIVPSETRGSFTNLVSDESSFPVLSDRQSAFYRIRFLRADSVYQFNNWLSKLFRSVEICNRKGPDAYQYLMFQQYIILLLAILSLDCMCLLLPINMEGGNDGTGYMRTTLSNISSDSSLFWVHAISATAIAIIGVYFMSYFSMLLKTDDDLMTRNTLLIRRLPKLRDTDMKNVLMEYFAHTFPQVKLTGIQLIYDFRDLDNLEWAYANVLQARLVCEQTNDRNKEQTKLRPYTLGRLGCCCCCCCRKVDAVQYYTEQMAKLNGKICQKLHKYAFNPPAAAFVTLENEKMASEVYTYFKEEENGLHLIRNTMDRLRNGNTFDLRQSLVNYAPYPYDINWRNIGIDMRLLWLRKAIITLILFVIFFFLSTPAYLFKIFEMFANKDLIRKGMGKFGSTLTDFLSPFILMVFAIILPSIVTYACTLIPYKTVSALNHAIMSKVFVFLLLMVILLPSAGFLSVNAFLENLLLPPDDDRKFRWNCLFPVDNGAFFVIYVLQAALLGNTMELLRIVELSCYVIYSLTHTISPAEYEKARKMVAFEFPFGVSYPRFLLIFTMTITYSHACPIIAPCGLVYMIIKHLVDRYNIENVYTPSKINGRIHSTAILYVHIGIILMLFQMFAFLLTKTQYSTVTIYSLVVLITSLLVFASHCFYHWFRNINHLTYKATTRFSSREHIPKHDLCICSYVPPVFADLKSSPVANNSEGEMC